MKDKYFKEFKQKGYFEKFDKKYFDEFEKELEEVIIPLQNNWSDLDEKELEVLLTKFGKICRNETSLLRKEVLTSISLDNTLLKIGSAYGSNSKILIEIVSSLNNMHSRYNLKITDDIFQFLLRQTENKKVNFYVSIFITELPQFKDYKNRVEYIMSIPKIAPKKKSINTFHRVINDNLDSIPLSEKLNAVKIFEIFLTDNPNLHDSTIKKYSSIINKLKD